MKILNGIESMVTCVCVDNSYSFKNKEEIRWDVVDAGNCMMPATPASRVSLYHLYPEANEPEPNAV